MTAPAIVYGWTRNAKVYHRLRHKGDFVGRSCRGKFTGVIDVNLPSRLHPDLRPCPRCFREVKG